MVFLQSKIKHPTSDGDRRPVAVDLFAGAGGFSLGLEQAGFDILVAAEIDPIHAAVYAFNSPQTKVLPGDLSQLSPELLREAVKQRYQAQTRSIWNGEIDLIAGGPPCQGFSLMGHRRLDDDRNDLVFHFCRLVKDLQPRYFVMENVPGMAQGKHISYLEELIAQFAAAGYQITYPVQVLNAADFGVPQTRRRLFLLGARQGEKRFLYPPVQTNRAPTVRDAIADLPNLDDFLELETTDWVCLSNNLYQQMQAEASPYTRQLLGITFDPHNFAHPRLWNPQLLTSSLRTHHCETSIQRFSETKPRQLDPISRLRRLDWEATCHTLRAGTGSGRGRHTSPRPIHPQYPRTISVREAARLHSFPDWFRFHTTKWHGFRQVGNAVPPLLARAVGRQAIAALGLNPTAPQSSLDLSNPDLLTFNRWDATRYWVSQARQE